MKQNKGRDLSCSIFCFFTLKQQEANKGNQELTFKSSQKMKQSGK